MNQDLKGSQEDKASLSLPSDHHSSILPNLLSLAIMSRVHNMSLMRSKQVSEEISELSSKMKQRTGAVGHSMTLLQASIKAVMERPTQVVGYVSALHIH